MTPLHRSPVLTAATLTTPFAEAYRLLRTNLNVTGGQEAKAILVSSGGAGDGKSTTVANLGILMAQAGHRVMLVDADFRHPWLDRLLELDGGRPTGVEALRRPGLSDLLAGTATPDLVAAPVRGIENLWLVAAGTVPANPSELLASEMPRVLGELRQEADVVLLDSPPCSLYADAFELTQVADAILYVLRSGKPGAMHLRLLKQLQQGKARLAGIVINQSDVGVARAYPSYREGGRGRA